MFKKDYYRKYPVSSKFGVDRLNWIHSGVDYVAPKGTKLVSMFDGVVYMQIKDKSGFGNQIIVKTNPKFDKGIDDTFYHSYCHCNDLLMVEKSFVKAGKQIATMGNSGDCYTLDNGQYRAVSESEKLDKDCNRGVHLHFWIYQYCAKDKTTPLLIELQKQQLITKEDYFYQWNKVIYNPQCIYNYFRSL